MTDQSASTGDTGRDKKGMFVKGNTLAKNNPRHMHSAACRAAIREAATPEKLAAAIEKMLAQAAAGDATAARVAFDRVLGRPREEEGGRVQIELPSIETASDVTKALGAIFAAVGRGEIDVDQAQRVAAVAEMSRRALETVQLEERIAQLEAERPQ